MNNNKRFVFSADAKFSIVKNPSTGVNTLSGYALVWNAISTDRGGYFVRLLPGSANFVDPTFALFNHDYNQVLARSDDNSLRMTSDTTGVKVEIDMPDTSYGKDVSWLVANGKVKGMSFAMIPGGDYQESSENGNTILNFSKFDADEVTITPIPAFTETTITAKKPNETEDGDYRNDETEDGEYLKPNETEDEAYKLLSSKLADDAIKLEDYRLRIYPKTIA